MDNIFETNTPNQIKNIEKHSWGNFIVGLCYQKSFSFQLLNFKSWYILATKCIFLLFTAKEAVFYLVYQWRLGSREASSNFSIFKHNSFMIRPFEPVGHLLQANITSFLNILRLVQFSDVQATGYWLRPLVRMSVSLPRSGFSPQ